MNMREHPDDVTIDGWVEGLLSDAQRAAIDTHLRACARCRAEVARQTELLAALRALPDRVDPGTDLRPAIRAGIDRARRARHGRRVLRSLRLPLAAAAVLLVAITATLTALLLADREADEVARRASDRGGIVRVADFGAARSEYVHAAEDLSATLERHRDALAPETVALVEQSLRTIDEALREADAALREDPASPLLRDMILENHEKKVEVLRWANSIARGT